MSEVLVEDRGHARWVTLNRPKAMNAITGEMLSQLNDAFKAADDDPKVRVVMLTGAGRGFCSGLDLKQAAAGEGIGGSGLASAVCAALFHPRNLHGYLAAHGYSGDWRD